MAVAELRVRAGRWPLHPFTLGKLCGLWLVPALGGRSRLVGRQLRYNCAAPVSAQRQYVLDAVARFMLRRHGIELSREALRYTVAALSEPERPLVAASGF